LFLSFGMIGGGMVGGKEGDFGNSAQADWVAVRLYELDNCDPSGRYFDVAPLTDYPCFTQTVRSGQVI
jgi:hypothetical protein